MAELWEFDACAAARAIRDRVTTAEALAECLVRRVDAHRDLNAFTTFHAERIIEAARHADAKFRRGDVLGPLHGVPVTFKDNIDVAFYPTTAGSPALRENVPAGHAPVVAALIGAGAIAFGKNTMHELAFGITCNNAAFGAVRNPYDPAMIPGGSSGGTAVAVAARMVPAGIGTDTGGSVRVPAALCGCCGFRPTLGRWPQGGIVPIAATRDTAGPIARSVDDLALIDGVVTDDQTPIMPIRPDRIRLGVPRQYFWADLDPETARLGENALKTLGDAGIQLVEADFDEDIGRLNQEVSFVIALYEPRRDVAAYLRSSNSALTFEQVVAGVSSPDVRATMNAITDSATQVSHEAYLRARDHHRPRLIDALRRYFADNRIDAAIFPTTPLPARPIGEDDTVAIGNSRFPTFATFIRNTDPGSNAGFPGVTIPIGIAKNGLPIGLALDGPAGADRRLLAIANAIARMFPSLEAPPDMKPR
jgi:mandelamide amidase